ncbi:MAG: glycosyltransferase family 39 protein, partial [Chloroflexi bacterium]|nr:glycosyltransferase family 39 protein [Chloroflexota bacterium]
GGGPGFSRGGAAPGGGAGFSRGGAGLEGSQGLAGRGGGVPGGAGQFGGAGRTGASRFGGGGNRGGQVDPKLLSYLEQHQGSTKFLLAVTSSMTADPYIINTGKPIMALGGFNGSDKILTVTQLKQLIQNGTVRYFLMSSGTDNQGPTVSPAQLAQLPPTARAQIEARLNAPGGGRGFGGRGNINTDLTNWVSKTCAAVPASAYGSTSANSSPGGFGGFGGGNQLYDCAGKAATQP